MDLTIETKDMTPVPAQLVGQGHDDLMRAFEEFKQTNDERLAQLEVGRPPSALLEEKLARIEETLDRWQQQLTGSATTAPLYEEGHSSARSSDLNTAHKAALESYVRKGDATKLHNLEEKALSIGSEADGGYLVPEETERRLAAALKDESPIRRIAGSTTISTAVYRKPFQVTGAGTGWVGEAEARSQTGTPQIDQLAFPAMELYAMPAATTAFLDDAAVDIENWIVDEVRSSFATREGQAFISGNGTAQPKGFLSYEKVSNSDWSWGKLGYVPTGTVGAFSLSNPADALVDLVFTLRASYRHNARFVMNRLTQSAVRKFKDANGNYLWQPALSHSLEPTLLGYPVAECEDMPIIAEDSFAIAFGDFRRGYLVVDRSNVRVLRDPFSAKPYVLFYCTKRVGGGVQDFNAIKLLKFGEA